MGDNALPGCLSPLPPAASTEVVQEFDLVTGVLAAAQTLNGAAPVEQRGSVAVRLPRRGSSVQAAR